MLKKIIVALLLAAGAVGAFVGFVLKIGKAYDEAIKDARL